MIDIPESHKSLAEDYHRALVEVASLADDQLVELILEEKPVPKEMLKAAIRKGTLEGKFTPIFCGSSKNFHGVQMVLDAVVDYLPSPSDRPPVSGPIPKSKDKERAERKPLPTEPFSGLAFKTVTEPTGDLVYTRIYSGELKPKDEVLNTTTGKTERVARILRMMGDRREPLDVAGPGEIVAVIGLKQTYTGHTLCDTDKPMTLEEIHFPDPVIAQAIIPDKTTDEAKLADALAKIVRDDPTLKFKTDPETKQLILSGMGELHLEVSVTKLQRTPGVKVTTGRPMVAYRQTLSKAVEFEYKFAKQTGGRGKYAVIYCRYEPLSKEAVEEKIAELEEEGEKPDPNNVFFTDKVVGGTVPREFIPSVEAGFRNSCVKGAKYGFPLVDINCTLIEGKYHDVDSSQDSFRMCSRGIDPRGPGQVGHHPARADHEGHGGRPGGVPGHAGRRHQPPAGRSRASPPTRAAARSTPSSRWRCCSATRRTSATPPAARRPSRWSRATTPPSARNSPTSARRRDRRSNGPEALATDGETHPSLAPSRPVFISSETSP